MAGTQGTTIKRAQYLSQQGCDVTVMSPLVCQSCEYNGVRYINIDDWRSISNRLREFKEHWDVVYSVGSPKLLRQTYIMPYLRSSLRILSIHIGFWHDPQRVRLINRYADIVICVSKALAQLLVNHGVINNKIQVVYNGVDTRVFYPHPVPRNLKQIIFAGALIPKKGIDTLLMAFNIVKSKIPDAKLVICGSADLYGVSQDWFNSLPIPFDGSVELRGKLTQSELAQEFSRSGLAVVPSSKRRCFEGVGKVSIEAQACSCPVVVSDNGGLPETVINGVTGRICPADDPKALADIIIQLLSNPNQLKMMGVKAVRHVQRNFLWEQTLKPLEIIIQQGIENSSLSRRITYLKRLIMLFYEKGVERLKR